MPKYPKITFRSNDPLQDYYSDGKGGAYSVAKLIDDTRHLKPFNMPLAGLNVSDEPWRGYCLYELAFHCKRVNEADLSKPIIIAWDGNIADGRHRVIKALMLGKRTIKAVRMTWKPEPCRREST